MENTFFAITGIHSSSLSIVRVIFKTVYMYSVLVSLGKNVIGAQGSGEGDGDVD